MQQRTLTLRYVPEIDDLMDMLSYFSPARRRVRRHAMFQAILTLTVVWALLVLLATAAPTRPAAFLALVLASGFVIYTLRTFVRSTSWDLRRRARKFWHRSPTPRQTHEAEIGPYALTSRADGRTSSYAWSIFSELRESDRQFVLLDHEGKPSATLPKRGLSDAALVPVCRALLTEHLAGTPLADSAAASTDGPPASADEPGSPQGQST
ncbi:YcxB family protein [Streptomyces sp. MBT65]|uniref:YcxB family protein n=1 Tax=Streptomyces sp. MBT65 TaxID=1488395 RepID=UPI00190BF1BA|nr:YcxB family protein [Streptomyces sp. MBT65]MBK3576630.1 YcxB family protein [Streptomyces sp. MBT65]